ncbi:FliH/SctL family protein [Candidatus Pelagisphaera phototrophica]|uniref:FliH/SctL family protein n=1 Tax=Candidatus Pelagisphaera phototrophica TaxID=2684113 RepID=UPI0024B7D562|nr:FliH/SctL family protein [Candidatus Pelagisphaera phototrophica]QXD31865.1 hypothetical protein GA004_16375 [Candidatus Pelagisphaera phototrophica]
MMSLRVSYDGPPRVDAKVFGEEIEKSYQKGYDEASQQHSQQILGFRSEVNALREKTFSDLENKFGKIVAEAREALMTLTHDCVSRTLGGVEFDSETILSIVNSVIEESGLDDEKMEVRLNPLDLALLEDLEVGIRSKHPRLDFAEDKGLQRGDCLLSSRFGKVDGLISTKLNRLKDGLRPS